MWQKLFEMVLFIGLLFVLCYYKAKDCEEEHRQFLKRLHERRNERKNKDKKSLDKS